MTTISISVVALSVMGVIAAAMNPSPANAQGSTDGNPVVVLETTLGTIEITLDLEKAPISVENFLAYMNEGFYDDTIFHRVIPGFMAQGGGFAKTYAQKETKPAIKNEATNGLKNDHGTVAMARTGEVNSATCQFFINLADNDFLNHKNTSPQGYGYAVFGKVTNGMEVVEAMAKVRTGSQMLSTPYGPQPSKDVPTAQMVIKKVSLKK